MGKRERERRRRERRMALLHGGAGKGGDSRRDGRSVGRRVHGASHHPAEAFDPGALRVSAAPDAARLTAILESAGSPVRAAEEILDLLGGDVAPFSLLGALHERSPDRARAIARAARDLAPESETALGLAVAVAEADDDPRRALSLMQGRVDGSSHPSLRVALAAALNREGRFADAAAVVEPLSHELPGLGEAEEELASAVIAAHVRVRTDDGRWTCPCGSGRTYARCCKPGERAVVERFLDRSAFDRFRERISDYSLRPGFAAVRAHAFREWFGDEHPPGPDDLPLGEAMAMIERAWLLLGATGIAGSGDTVLDRFARDRGNSPQDRRRAEDWSAWARYGLWRDTGEAAPPGIHLEDLLTGSSHYVAMEPEQREAMGEVFLGMIVPFDGVWRTGATLMPVSVEEAHELRDGLLVRLSEIGAGHGSSPGDALVADLEEVRGFLVPGIPPAGLPPELSLLLSSVAGAALPDLVGLLRARWAREVVLTNTAGEPLEMIEARVAVADLAGTRDRLLARADVWAESDEVLVWEGDRIPPQQLREMHEHLRRQGAEVEAAEEPQRWILGRIRVESDALVVEVNSRARFRRFLGILEALEASPVVVAEETTRVPQPPHAAEALSWLHPSDPLPDPVVPATPDLADAASGSATFVRVRALLALLGDRGRRLTTTGNLQLADGRALAEAIGVEFDDRFGNRVYRRRSSGEVREITETLAMVRAAGLVRVVHGWARPTKRAARFGRDPVADWWSLFESFVRKVRWPERRGDRPWWAGELGDLTTRLLEEIYRAGGEDVAASELAARAVAVLGVRSRLDQDQRTRLADWIDGDIAYGMMLPLVDLGALALDERPLSRERPAGWTAVEGARTTPLGAWAIHRLITDRP